MTDQRERNRPSRRRDVFFFVGLALAFFGLVGAGVVTMFAESEFHGLSFENTRPALLFLIWGGLTGVALCLRSRIARVSLAVWAISVIAWGLVLWVQASGGSGGGDDANPPVIASQESAEPQTAMTLPGAHTTAADPEVLESPPPIAFAEAEPGCTVEVMARQGKPTFGYGPPAVARLEFGISASRNEQGDPLMEFETEPDGTARIDVPWSDVQPGPDGKRPWLWLRSSDPGLLTRITRSRAPKEPGATLTMSVDVQPGVRISGRILGPDGAPVAGHVDWWSFGEEGVPRSSLGQAGSDGLFSGELLREGTHGLLARGSSKKDSADGLSYDNQTMDLGTGFSELFDVNFDEPVPFIEVRVSGPGVLRGRVLDETGAPAAGLTLMAVVAELDDEQGSMRLPYPRSRELEQEGRGHLWIQARTDGDGGFELRGLRNDLYNLRASLDGKSSGGFPELLTDRPVPSHGDPLELRLSRPHLAIHVREMDGSVPVRELTVHQVARWGGTLDEWPEDPGLLVALGARHAHMAGWRGPYLEAKSVAPGEFVVELADKLLPDRAIELDVGLLGGDVAWQRVPVAVPPGSGRVDVDLVLPPPTPMGALVLDVADAQGTALVEQVRIRVIDPDSGVVLVDTPCNYTDEGDWPMRFEMPEGDYLLLVEGHPWIEDHHGTIMERRVHGAFEQPLRVSSGAETRVTAVLGGAARLSVRMVGGVTEADRQVIRDRYGEDAEEEFVESWAPFVSLRLEQDGRWPVDPEYARYGMEGTSAAGTHLYSSVALGQEETSEPLSPGTYTLVASTRGGREVRRTITLVPGETLSVTLTFE